MVDIKINEIVKAIKEAKELIKEVKNKVKCGDIENIKEVKFESGGKEIYSIEFKDGRHLSLIDGFYVNGKIEVSNGNKSYVVPLEVLNKDIVEEIKKEMRFIYSKVRELLNDIIKKEYMEGKDMDKEIITEDIKILIDNYKKEVKIEFIKDYYETNDIKKIIDCVNGINGDVLKLYGKAPIWLYTSVSLALKNMFKKIEIFDPKLGGWICVYSLEKISLGKVEKEEV